MYTPEQIRQGRATLNDFARAAGRDPRAIEVVAVPVPAEPEMIRQYEDAGADAAVIFYDASDATGDARRTGTDRAESPPADIVVATCQSAPRMLRHAP